MAGLRHFELTETQKGFVYLIVGIVVLLYAFNFFQAWLNTLVIIGGILLTGYGFMKIGGIEKIKELVSKSKK
jgi:hypothetical protein